MTSPCTTQHEGDSESESECNKWNCTNQLVLHHSPEVITRVIVLVLAMYPPIVRNVHVH